MSQVIGDCRENFYIMSIPKLQEELMKQGNDGLQAIFEYLSDQDWLTQQHERKKINELVTKVYCVIPPEDAALKIMGIFVDKLNFLKIQLPRPEDVMDSLFQHNLQVFKKFMIYAYNSISSNSREIPANDEIRNLCQLEAAMDIKIPNKICDILIREASLDHKSTLNHDIFDIVCLKGNIEHIKTVLDIYHEKKGSGKLEVYVENRGAVIGRFIARNDAGVLNQLIELFHAKNLKPASFICSLKPGIGNSALEYCEEGEKFKICFDQLYEDQVKYMMSKLLGQINLIIRREPAGFLEWLLKSLQKCKVPLSELLFYKDIDSYTILDVLCICHLRDHLSVLLTGVNDEDLSKLLFSKGCGYTPLELCNDDQFEYIGAKKACADLLNIAMERLSQQKAKDKI